jgi:hypothetical protein
MFFVFGSFFCFFRLTGLVGLAYIPVIDGGANDWQLRRRYFFSI